jgi:hypothetical protein
MRGLAFPFPTPSVSESFLVATATAERGTRSAILLPLGKRGITIDPLGSQRLAGQSRYLCVYKQARAVSAAIRFGRAASPGCLASHQARKRIRRFAISSCCYVADPAPLRQQSHRNCTIAAGHLKSTKRHGASIIGYDALIITPPAKAIQVAAGAKCIHG